MRSGAAPSYLVSPSRATSRAVGICLYSRTSVGRQVGPRVRVRHPAPHQLGLEVREYPPRAVCPSGHAKSSHMPHSQHRYADVMCAVVHPRARRTGSPAPSGAAARSWPRSARGQSSVHAMHWQHAARASLQHLRSLALIRPTRADASGGSTMTPATVFVVGSPSTASRCPIIGPPMTTALVVARRAAGCRDQLVDRCSYRRDERGGLGDLSLDGHHLLDRRGVPRPRRRPVRVS